jgi:hypothetical protein
MQLAFRLLAAATGLLLLVVAAKLLIGSFFPRIPPGYVTVGVSIWEPFKGALSLLGAGVALWFAWRH